MKDLDHPNIVQLLGIVSRERPVWIVLEFLQHGDVLSYLRKYTGQIEPKVIMKVCAEVANGMTYLEEKLIIHRDLAARNVLLSDDGIAKIADFVFSCSSMDFTPTAPERLLSKMPLAGDGFFLGLLSTAKNASIFTHKKGEI